MILTKSKKSPIANLKFAVIWLALCVVLSQFVDDFGRGIYPFFHWRLFSRIAVAQHGLSLDCPDRKFPHLIDPLFHEGYFHIRDRGRYAYRMHALLVFFKASERNEDEARRRIKDLVWQSLIDPKGCAAVLYHYRRKLDVITNIPLPSDIVPMPRGRIEL